MLVVGEVSFASCSFRSLFFFARGVCAMDERRNIIHQATNRLGQSSHLFLRHLECSGEDGVVVIEGKVPSYYLKQTAQSLVQSIEGVEKIINRLDVVNAYGVSE